eukprot:ANDGO_03612.mRNA.1 Conserved oligomeric Golgi complex subunit 7
MDSSSFADPEFSALEYVNSIFRQAAPGQNPSFPEIDTLISTTLSRLAHQFRDISRSLEESSAVMVTRVPRITMELDRVRRDAQSLKGVLEKLAKNFRLSAENSAAASQNFHVLALNDESISEIASIDRVYAKLEKCENVLREALFVSSNIDELELAFHGSEYQGISVQLSKLENSMRILEPFPQFSYVNARLKEYQERLERILEPAFVESLRARLPDLAKPYAAMFRAIDATKVNRKYADERKRVVLDEWTMVDSSKVSSFSHYLESAIAFFKDEHAWLSSVFEDISASPLSLLISIVLEEMRIAEFFARVHRSSRSALDDLQEMCSLWNAFPQELSNAIPDVPTSRILGLVYDPFISFLEMFPRAEAEKLRSQNADLRTILDVVSRFVSAQFSLSYGLFLPQTMAFADSLIVQVLSKRSKDSAAQRLHFTVGQGLAEPKIVIDATWNSLKGLIIDYQFVSEWRASLAQYSSFCMSKIDEALKQISLNPVPIAAYICSKAPQQFKILIHKTELLVAGGKDLFPGAVEEWSGLRGALNKAILECMIAPVRVFTESYSSSPLWIAQPEESPYELPTFAPPPSDQITVVGDYLLSLPEQVESLGAAEGVSILEEVCSRSLDVFLHCVENVPQFSSLGLLQLSADARYMQTTCGYLSDQGQGNRVSLVFEDVIRLADAKPEELDEVLGLIKTLPPSVIQAVKFRKSSK